MVAVSGPTYDQVPPFVWSELKPNVKTPRMHPDKWNFPSMVVSVVDDELQSLPTLKPDVIG